METLKSLYDYETQDAPMLLDIRSDKVLPLSSGNNKHIFRLEPTGYLDKNSMLMFKLKSNVADTLRMNVLNGGLGAIKRVQLAVGDYILNDVEGVSEWATLHNFMEVSRSAQNASLSQYLGNQLYTKVADSKVDDASGVEQQSKGEIIPDSERAGLAVGGSANASTTDGAYDSKVAVVNSLKISQNASNNHQVGIPLGMIIPALKNRRIPLFLFTEYRIYITIEFNDASQFVNNLAKTDYSGNETLQAASGDVSFEDVKLQVDYIIEPAELMEKMRNKINDAGGLVLDFYDVVRVETQLEAGTNGAVQRKEFKLGQNNREVHKIYMTRKFTDKTGFGRNLSLLNEQRIDGVNTESINWYINGKDLYPESEVNSNAILYDHVNSALDRDLDVERPMFMNALDTQFAAMTSPNNPFNGTYKPLAVDLRNGNPGILGAGTLIGNYPIVCKYSRIPTAAVARATGPPAIAGFRKDLGAMDVNFYVMASRRAVIKQGVKGNDVQVTY